MSDVLEFDAEWELLEAGPPEERACFAALGIRHGDRWLTEADDRLVKRVRTAVYLSAYRFAEWLAWNWWRLRWEPPTRTQEWALAHRLSTVGGGYVWPNITFSSDGERIVLLARPTQPSPVEPVRYLADMAAIVRARDFEGAVDRFIDQVRGQLRAEGIAETNLDRIWTSVREERADAVSAMWRRLEAMLGFDPDEADASLIERLVADAQTLGQRAVAELAAEHAAGGATRTAKELYELAISTGTPSRPADAVRLRTPLRLPAMGDVPAWQRGTEVARALRDQEHLGPAPIANERLSAMAGVASGALTGQAASASFSFALDETRQAGHVALRSKFETGRRFELARLIGDRLGGGADGALFPATRTDTYRQKYQRAFAAELLCPFDALEDMLGGDYSPEAIEDAARHFNVSQLTVRTLLVNHRRLDRDDLERDLEAAAAA